jgi:hypothetical protein
MEAGRVMASGIGVDGAGFAASSAYRPRAAGAEAIRPAAVRPVTRAAQAATAQDSRFTPGSGQA